MERFFQRFFPHEDWDACAGYHREISARLVEKGKILDLGCGDQSQLAAYRTAERQVWGTDFQVHPRLQHPEWFRLLGPTGQIPFSAATFDLVTSSWVMEHVETPVIFMREVSRVLRPAGRFVALTVNARHYVSWAARLLHLLPHRVTQELIRWLYGRSHHDTFPTRYRLNTVKELRHIARSNGLVLESVVQYANPGYFAFWQPLWRCGRCRSVPGLVQSWAG